jgi:hypothetical protein
MIFLLTIVDDISSFRKERFNTELVRNILFVPTSTEIEE